MVWRVEAYLRIACSVLGFETGELWCARKISGTIAIFFIYEKPIIIKLLKIGVSVPKQRSSHPRTENATGTIAILIKNIYST